LFQQAAIELSLYLRDASGQPVQAGLDRLPSGFPVEDGDRIADTEAAIAIGLQRRPELKALGAQIQQTGVDVSIAENAAKPAVDPFAGFTSDQGSDPSVRRGPEELKVGVAFEFPFQNRSARGKVAAPEAKRRQLEQRAAYLRDHVAAEVRDAQSAVAAARNRLRVLQYEVHITRELEEAEKARFELGEGTLFVLNLREQATLDVTIREALAHADYQRSLARLAYATGELMYP
jgi:outer membrane protein TolC